MSDTFTRVPVDSTGDRIDMESLTVAATTVQRQRIQIAGTADTEIAGIAVTSPAEDDFGLVTRPILRKDGEELSTTPLGNGASFTQSWQDGNEDGVVYVEASVKSDQASAGSGFAIHAADNTGDWYIVALLSYTDAGNESRIRAAIHARYWRILYTNGAVGQATFRLSATASNIPSFNFGEADYDTGAGGQVNQSMVGLALPAAGGPVAGGTSSNPIIIDPVGTTTQPVDVTDRAARDLGKVDIAAFDVELPAGTQNIGDVDIASLPDEGQQNMAGSISVAIASDQSALPVDLGANNDVVAAGDVAAQAAETGNPIKIGGRAHEHGANPPASAADQRVEAIFNRHGIQFFIGGHPNIVTREYMATTAQTNDPIIDSIASGNKIVITMIDVTIDNVTTPDVGVRIGFGTATVPAEPADGASVVGVVLSHPGIAPGSGIVRGDGSGIVGIGADDAELRITNEVPTDGKLRVIVTYFIIPS